MQLLQDGVIALLAAIGLTALLWSLAGWIFRPRGRIPGTVFLLVPVRGAAPGMEQTLRALRGAGIDRRAEVLLADCGLTDEARRRAERVERSDAARICTPAELAQILQEEEECYGRAMHGGGNRTEHHLSE